MSSSRDCRTEMNHGFMLYQTIVFNTLRPRQNARHFPDDIFKCIFLNENVSIVIKFSVKFVAKGPINNIAALVQIMAWCRPGDKPLSEPMMVSLPTHICVTRPQWVNGHMYFDCYLYIAFEYAWPCLLPKKENNTTMAYDIALQTLTRSSSMVAHLLRVHLVK